MNTSPTLLTVEEAAAIGRCSVKTVRRAYATGALVAYRRGGSRAVLLDRRDVLAWVQGEIVKPVVPTMAENDPARAGAPAQRLGRQQSQAGTAGRPGGRARFDLSAAALRERRAATVEPAS
jgi:excisionase family DNA binding protein